MDDFIDPFLSSPTWSELSTPSRSSWTGNGASQANDLLAGSVEAYAEDGNNTSICVIPSTHIAENVASEDLDPRSNLLLNGVFESNSISGSYGQDLNTSCSLTLPHSALTMSRSIESIASEPCKFVQSRGDLNSISPVPSMWPPSYAGVSSFTEQGNLQGFCFQGMETDADVLGVHYAENGNYSQMNKSATMSLQDDNGLNSPNLHTFNLAQQVKAINGCVQPLKQEQNGMQNLHMPNFSSRPPIKSTGLQAHYQLSQSTEVNSLKHQTNNSTGGQEKATPTSANGCNGTAKPRVRARRGQATDPHSIAERLRREKIAERMKNLQELVPDSNKTDKASMLDEIIDYVKFLQLQVKVLSMSRLGAAGAVVPLITDRQPEGSTLHLSSKELEEANLSEAERSLALEQEVVNLLESNLTTAMQYLQNKGLCLMPIALASAISGQKGSASAAIPPDRRKPNGNPQDLSEKINGENGVHNINNCGSVIKQEEAAVKSV